MPSIADAHRPTHLTALPVQLRGRAWAHGLLRLAGWRVRCAGLPARQGVAIVYPHTSNWDFVVGVLAKWAIGIPVTFWGKERLFRIPVFGWWLRRLGGVPVNRDSPHGVVGHMTRELVAAREEDRFLWFALSPEGTRRRSAGWRSGFYHAALAARVPLALVSLDYADKVVGVDRFLMLGGDVDADMAAIDADLGHRRGRHPDLATPVRLES